MDTADSFAYCRVFIDKMKINPVNFTSQSAPSQGLLFIQQSENADRRPGKILRRRHPRSRVRSPVCPAGSVTPLSVTRCPSAATLSLIWLI